MLYWFSPEDPDGGEGPAENGWRERGREDEASPVAPDHVHQAARGSYVAANVAESFALTEINCPNGILDQTISDR